MGELPIVKEQQLRWKKGKPLKSQIGGRAVLGNLSVECDDRKSGQIRIVLQFLRGSVMLVMLVVPVRS